MAGQVFDGWWAGVARVFSSPYRIAFAYVLGLIPVMLAGSDGGWLLFGYIAPFFLFAAAVIVAAYALLIRLAVGGLRHAVGRIKVPKRRRALPFARTNPLWDRWVDG